MVVNRHRGIEGVGGLEVSETKVDGRIFASHHKRSPRDLHNYPKNILVNKVNKECWHLPSHFSFTQQSVSHLHISQSTVP